MPAPSYREEWASPKRPVEGHTWPLVMQPSTQGVQPGGRAQREETGAVFRGGPMLRERPGFEGPDLYGPWSHSGLRRCSAGLFLCQFPWF